MNSKCRPISPLDRFVTSGSTATVVIHFAYSKLIVFATLQLSLAESIPSPISNCDNLSVGKEGITTTNCSVVVVRLDEKDDRVHG